jgi:serine/threonine protein kinase
MPRETQAGTILGTIGYMSPEQASGQPADFRSDQFSLGSILYEMATGRRAFDGPTDAQTLSAIIEAEPTPPPGDHGAPGDGPARRASPGSSSVVWRRIPRIGTDRPRISRGISPRRGTNPPARWRPESRRGGA